MIAVRQQPRSWLLLSSIEFCQGAPPHSCMEWNKMVCIQDGRSLYTLRTVEVVYSNKAWLLTPATNSGLILKQVYWRPLYVMSVSHELKLSVIILYKDWSELYVGQIRMDELRWSSKRKVRSLNTAKIGDNWPLSTSDLNSVVLTILAGGSSV